MTRAKSGRRLKAKTRTRSKPRKTVGARAGLETALALLAHEVRTPLNGILAFSELLASGELGQREREWAAAIKSAAMHLDLYTTLVVDSAKAGAGRLVLRHEAFRPRGWIEAIAATLAGRAAAKGLSSRTDVDEDLPDILVGDPVRLRAVVENLIDNAVKFTDSGEVRLAVALVKTTAKTATLAISVADSGAGLSPSQTRRLFRPFSQAGASVSRRYGGTGLGLAFVQRIARAMHGKVVVRSRLGQGSTFRFEARLDRPQAKRAVQLDRTVVHAPESGQPGLRILCAEDNPYGRVVLNTILTSLGHQVDFAGTGEAAVQAVSRTPYDLVLMDISLPGMDGIEATKHIRALPGVAARMHIIGLSAHAGSGEEAAARAAGMNQYLTKPVSAERIAAAIARNA